MKNPLILVLAFLLCSALANAQSPTNDICTNARLLTVDPDCTPTAGTLYRANNTTTTGGSNCGTRADVWYKFVLPASTTSVGITVTLTSGSTPLKTDNTYIEMVSGTSCPTTPTSSGGCNNITTPRFYGTLAAGTYYFRVNTNVNTFSGASDAYNFNVCVTSNDNCATASTVPPGTTLDGSLRGVSASGVAAVCGGDPNDDVWYKFNPVLDYATLSLSNIGGDFNTAGPKMELYRGSCGSLIPVACGSTTINVTGLLTTSTYYCRIYSNATTQTGTNHGFRFSVMPSALTRVTGSRMNEVYNQQILSSPQILADPWEVIYGPDNHLWVTESKGYKVYRVNPVTGTRDTILDISQNSTTSPDVNFRCQFNNGSGAQGGLAGMALHPKFLDADDPQNFVYLAYVYSQTSSTVFVNRLVRFEYNPATKKLITPVSLCDTLPGSSDHNSQRMIIAPVGGVNYLFYAEGDMGAGQFGNAARTIKAQMINSYEGKILRFNLDTDGDAGLLDRWIPSTGTGHTKNPFNDTLGILQSAVWAIGVRNNQGFAYDTVLNKLYGSSHGPFSDDEINVIGRANNYGHPLVIGYAGDGNVNGTTAGAGPGMSPSTGSCPLITDEAAAAAAIINYRDPLFSAYPKSDLFPSVKALWDEVPISGNGLWPSEGWSGLDFYSNTVIPGWKRSLVASSLKWGRLVRIRLDKTGDSTAFKSRANNTFKQDTVSYFGSTNRFRDLAFAPNGKDIYVVMDRSTSTSGPSALYPVVPACQGCLQKYSFLGYSDVAGQSSIDTSIDVTHGIVNNCNTGTTVTIDASNNNLWVPITGPDGNIMAEIYPNGQNLGTVTSSFYKNSTGSLRMRNGSSYADRNVTITPQNQPASAVKVRIYMSKKEYDDFDANALSGITGLADLRIHKNSDPCQSAIAAATSIINPQFKLEHGDSAYVLQADISGFSTFYIGSTNVLLPLTSLNFKGKYKDEISYLNWETSNESNTDRFEVERNTGDGTYISIGTVVAKGNNSSKTQYSLNDNDASKLGTSRLYYRLRVIDKDGSYTYSNVVVVDIPGSFITRISIFPNPADKQTTVLISSPEEQKVTWQLIDVTGRSVITKTAVLKKGENRITIDLNGLRTGVYFLQVKGQFVNAQEKIQKL